MLKRIFCRYGTFAEPLFFMCVVAVACDVALFSERVGYNFCGLITKLLLKTKLLRRDIVSGFSGYRNSVILKVAQFRFLFSCIL